MDKLKNRNVKEQGVFLGDGKDTYYQVNIPNYQPDSVNEEYIFNLTGSSTTGSILKLYDANKKRLTSTSRLGSSTSTLTQKLEPGTYYVLAAGYYSSKTGNYSLRVTSATTKWEPTMSLTPNSPATGTFNKDELQKTYIIFLHNVPDSIIYRQDEFQLVSKLSVTATLLDSQQQPIQSIHHQGQIPTSKIDFGVSGQYIDEDYVKLGISGFDG